MIEICETSYCILFERTLRESRLCRDIRVGVSKLLTAAKLINYAVKITR